MTNVYTEDLCIMGNGIIGSITALLAARAGLKVALCGPLLRPGAASTAAGAMLNVYGEIDGRLDAYGRRKLALGAAGIEAWRKILPPEIFVADQTRIYITDTPSTIERICYQEIAMALGEERASVALINGYITLDNEPAVHTGKLFAWLENELRQCVRILPNNWWQSGLMSIAPKTLWCAGVWTPKIIGEKCASTMLPLFSGNGTAMVVKNAMIDLPERTVMRTPNRGNTCGVHVVPRGENEWYIGAGSFISVEPMPGYRLETITYLANCVAKELKSDLWHATVEPVVGHRPVSFDGKPMLGPLKVEPSYYVATGTKRDGLTYAPIIAEDVIAWAKGEERIGMFHGWEPDREPISWGEGADAAEAYILNRVAALRSHGKKADEKAMAIEWALASLRAREKYKLADGFCLHPEIVAVM